MDNSGLYSLYYFLEEKVYFVPIVLFLLLLRGGFAVERGKNHTFFLLKMQTVSLQNVYMGKVLHGIGVLTISTILIVTFIAVMGTIVNRFGDWYYPILHYDHQQLVNSPTYTGMISEGKGFHFVPLGEIVIKNTILFFLCSLLIMIKSQLLSIVFKHMFSVFMVTIFIFGTGYVVTSFKFTEIALFLPFTYFRISEVTNGALTILFDNPNIQFYMGCFTLIISTVLLTLIGYVLLILRRRSSIQ